MSSVAREWFNNPEQEAEESSVEYQNKKKVRSNVSFNTPKRQ